jgi:hypothetical protein
MPSRSFRIIGKSASSNITSHTTDRGWAQESGARTRVTRRVKAMAAEDSANGLVGAGHADLEQFALNPTVASAGVLASQAQDELAALGGETGASEPGRRANRAHLRRTRSRCQRDRVWGLTRKQNQVGRGRPRMRPASVRRSTDRQRGRLTWRTRTRVGAGGPELEPEAGVRASVIDEGIEEQTEDGIEESEKHDRGILAGWILW